MSSNLFERYFRKLLEDVTSDAIAPVDGLKEIPVGNVDSYAPNDPRNVIGQYTKKKRIIHKRKLNRTI